MFPVHMYFRLVFRRSSPLYKKSNLYRFFTKASVPSSQTVIGISTYFLEGGAMYEMSINDFRNVFNSVTLLLSLICPIVPILFVAEGRA